MVTVNGNTILLNTSFWTRLKKGRRQLRVDLKDLERNAGSVDYFRSELDGSVKVRGTLVRLHIERARDAKQILHKFVRQAGLAGYREVVVHLGLVKVEAPEEKKRRNSTNDCHRLAPDPE